VFVILLVISKFLVIKAEHTVASYNDRDFTSKIATVYFSGIQTFLGDFPLTKYLFLRIRTKLGDFPLIKFLFFKNSGRTKTFSFEKVVIFVSRQVLIFSSSDIFRGFSLTLLVQQNVFFIRQNTI
jgi:hypothetical protein